MKGKKFCLSLFRHLCIYFLGYLYHNISQEPMPKLWGQLRLISKPNVCMPTYIGVLFHTPCNFFVLQNKKKILICLNWLSEWPWYNQLIMYIFTYLDGVKEDNSWQADLSHSKYLVRRHELRSQRRHRQTLCLVVSSPLGGSEIWFKKALIMSVCRWRQDLLCINYNLPQTYQNATAGPKKNTS